MIAIITLQTDAKKPIKSPAGADQPAGKPAAKPTAKSTEVGGRDGPDPTRYGDWENTAAASISEPVSRAQPSGASISHTPTSSWLAPGSG